MRKTVPRPAGIELPKFMNEIVEPVMAQVAANRIKRVFGLCIAAIAGRASIFPYNEEYNSIHTTPPFQTFSAELNRFAKQPAYNGIINKTHTVLPAHIPLELTQIPVFATFNSDYNVPKKVVDRLKTLCYRFRLNPEIFISSGGTINLNKPFLQVCAYFATDTGLADTDKLWHHSKPMTHPPIELLEKEDLPQRLKNKVFGRQKGRPRDPNFIPLRKIK